MSSRGESRADAFQLYEAELTARLHWFIRLRWLAALGVVSATLGARPILGIALPAAPLLAVALGIVAYNIVCLGLARRLTAGGRAIPFPAARWLALVQIATDLLCLGILLHYSGGVENPVASFFAFHMIIAGILLSREMAYMQATLATAVFAAVVGLERYGVLPHVSLRLFSPPGFYATDRAWLVVLTVSATLYLLVYMTTSITGRLRQREREEAELAQQLAEKAAALEQAYADLESTQKLQVTYMRRTSHELRSPLAAVASILDVVSEGLTGEVPPKQREMLDRVRNKVRHLMVLTDDLLTLLRTRAAAPREQFEAVGLEHLIEGVVALLSERAEPGGVQVTMAVPPGLPPVRGDRELLTQLVTNLVANALKYTPAGGSVRVEANADEQCVLLRVADTGIGIAPEEQPRVFDEFYRTKAGREFTSTGTGLGLSIVKSIAQAHGADISLDSEPGRGTTFTVTLPRADAGPRTEDP